MNKQSSSKKPETIADRVINSTWCGRSLDNYKAQYPDNIKVQQARSLTAARIAATGEHTKKVGVCQCKQGTCQRYARGKSSHC